MKADRFEKSVKWLESFIPDPEHKHPGELGLSRMKLFIEKLGNPQNNYPVILVAGTSGKGSTATMISSILSQRLKVGLHVKPHLVTIRERIQINGEKICEGEFVRLVQLVKLEAEGFEKSSLGRLSYFEILVGMSYLYFSRVKVDVAVVEVGMGGRLDGTNVVTPKIAVITSIGFDHVPFLGTTPPQILNEKAGIIKNGCPVISGINQPELILQLSQICKKEKSKLSLLNREFHGLVKKMDIRGSVFDYKGKFSYKNIQLNVLGVHQIRNALVAIQTVEQFYKVSIMLNSFQHLQNGSSGPASGMTESQTLKQVQGDEISNIRNGLLKVKIPGRMEIISKSPLILLDGAHNEDKSKALAESLKLIFPHKKIITILGIKKDKDASNIIKFLIDVSSEIILTEFSIYSDVGNDTSMSISDLKEILVKLKFEGKVKFAKNVEEAINFAKSETDKDGMILITGSMYLVGEVKSSMFTMSF